MKNYIKCNNCKKEYKLSDCLVKPLAHNKYKFILPCDHIEVKSNINFEELLKLFNRDNIK